MFVYMLVDNTCVCRLVMWNVSLRVRGSWEQRKCSCKVTWLGRKGGSEAPRLNTKESSLYVRRAHDERLLRSSLAWSGKAPARLSAKNCRCSSTGKFIHLETEHYLKRNNSATQNPQIPTPTTQPLLGQLSSNFKHRFLYTRVM